MGVLEREIQDLKRFEQILVILAEEGFGLFLSRLRLMDRVPLVKRFRKSKTVPGPERLRNTFERLGPTFIKFGQILAQRPDILPQEYIAELEKLEDAVPPFDPATAKTIVEEDLGPVEDVFDTFEEEPVAAASIAQVHRARLKSGEEVAVKVRRPGIKEQMRKDLDILLFLAKRGEKHVSKLRKLGATRSAREFARWTENELDLRKEARNGQILQENLEDEERIKVPDIYQEHTTERVLVMEYVDGVKSNDVAALQDLDIDAKEVARTGVRAGLKQVVRDGFFHADPHPSNFLVSPDGKLIYLDFGMVGKFSKTMRRDLGMLLLYAVEEDVDGAVKMMVKIGTLADDADMDGLRNDVEEILTTLSHTAIGEQSIVFSLLQMAGRAYDHGLSLPPALTIMGKGLLTMEGIGLAIYPEFEITKEYEDLVENLLLQMNSPRQLLHLFVLDLLEHQDLFTQFPSHVSDLIDGISNTEERKTVVYNESGIDTNTVLIGVLLLSATILLIETLPANQLLYVGIIDIILAVFLLLR